MQGADEEQLEITVRPIPATNEVHNTQDEGLALASFYFDPHGYLIFLATKSPSTWPIEQMHTSATLTNVLSLHWDELKLALQAAKNLPACIILVEPTTREVSTALTFLKKQGGDQEPILIILFAQDERQLNTASEIAYRTLRKVGTNSIKHVAQIYVGCPY